MPTIDSKVHYKMPAKDRLALAVICFLFACLAIFSPVWPGNSIAHYLGELLLWIGVLEIYDGFRRSAQASKNSAQISGALSLLMAALLINAALFQRSALVVFVMFVFTIDALRYLLSFWKAYRNKKFNWLSGK